MNMDIKMLRDYNEWLKRSPEEILDAVRQNRDGWAAVFNSAAFPKGLPVWAHRVRNYFNREPLSLIRLSESESTNLVKAVYKIPSYTRVRQETLTEKVKRLWALTDHVYKDENYTTWFQMSPAGSIYHFKEIGNETLEGLHQEWLGQSVTPIFKLVSPDGTGGSMETIIDNPLRAGTVVQALLPKASRGFVIGNLSALIPVPIIKEPRYQGSYNYAETVDLGNADHDRLDVQPHKNTTRYKTYVNPTNRFAPLKLRKFPVYAIPEIIPLAEQI